jgi:hypothetical protein
MGWKNVTMKTRPLAIMMALIAGVSGPGPNE